MSMQPPLPPVSPRPQPQSGFTVLLAFLGLGVAAFLFLLLPMGWIGPVVVFGGFFFAGIAGLHYLVWGRWIQKLIEEDDQLGDS